MITNEVGGNHRGDRLVVPHVDVVNVGVVVEATGDEVVGDGLHLVPSLGDGGVPLCDVDGYFITFLIVGTLCLLFNHFFLAYARVG
jgi:hypothetical protein